MQSTFIGLTAESVLRPGEIFPVCTAPGEYQWQWQPQGGEPMTGIFEHFFDCLQDAREHGFEPQYRADGEDEPVGDLVSCPKVVPLHRSRAP